MTNYEYSLMPEEVDLYEKFRKYHKTCDPGSRGVMLEEEASPIYTEIILYMSTLGMCPSAKCCVCGQTKSIACEERLDSV